MLGTEDRQLPEDIEEHSSDVSDPLIPHTAHPQTKSRSLQRTLTASNPKNMWTSIGLASDVILLVGAVVMISMVGGHQRRAGGSYAWSRHLLLTTGILLLFITVAGIASTVSASLRVGKCSMLIKSVYLGQVVVVSLLFIFEILSIVLFFSFFGKLTSASSREIDVDFPVFSNFANCSWNACCSRTHVRERSYEKLICDESTTGFSSNTQLLQNLCSNLPHEHVNASKCVMGDGRVGWRQDLSAWIFREIMSWSWVVFTLIVMQLVAVAIYTCRWLSTRAHQGDISRQDKEGMPVTKK